MSWNIEVENEEIVINLTVEEQAASTALLAAARAESAKAGAETAEDGAATSASQAAGSASDALDSEQAALASQQAAANSASEALNSKNAAANSASDALASKNAALASENAAAQSASSALASKNAAAQSETNAGNSASTASTQAGIATDKANLATEKATLAGTKADEAAQSAAEALASKNSAQSSADIAATQAGIATDKSTLATTKANEASQSANNALASEQNASASEAIALQAQGQAEYAAVQAGTSASVAQQAANDAVAVVTGGTASLLPEAGKIPIANAQGKIDAGWIDPVSSIDSQALHRSPNAVTSMFIYDTSKDSDGGAWTEKCQHTSWFNETMQGRWLGQHLNEVGARNFNPIINQNNFLQGLLSSNVGWTRAGATVENESIIITSGGGFIYRSITNYNGERRRALLVKFQINLPSGTATIRINNVSSDYYNINSSGYYEFFLYDSGGSGPYILFSSTAEGTVFSNIEVFTTSQTTQSNDYYQWTTDGRFYRLNKNLLAFSNDFTNVSAWNGANGDSGTYIRTANSVIAPDGTMTADTIEYVSGNPMRFGRRFTGFTFPLGQRLCLTVWVQLATGSTVDNIIETSIQNASSNGGFNFTTLATGVGTELMETVGTWHKLKITGTVTNTTSIAVNFAGLAGLRVNLWNAQLEYGLTPTAYENRTGDLGISITEVFRGNKRSFPKIAGIVAEAGNVNIYDLTETGNPMWMRFNSTIGSAMARGSGVNQNVRDVAMCNGIFIGGTHQTGCTLFNFPSDKFSYIFQGNWFLTSNAFISFRNSSPTLANLGGFASNSIKSNEITALSITYLQDAPIDPVTGLKVPTIAIGQSLGVSIVKHTGQVVNNSTTFNASRVSITPSLLVAIRNSSELYYAKNPNNLGASFALSTILATQDLGFGTSQDIQSIGLSKIIRGLNTSQVKPALINIDAFARSINATISNLFNTGYMVGSIRRAYLADVVTGNIEPSTELVTGDSSDFTNGIGGWTSTQGATLERETTYFPNGGFRITNTTNGNLYTSLEIDTIVGKYYGFELICGFTNINTFISVSNTNSLGQRFAQNTIINGGVTKLIFQASASKTFIQIFNSGGGVTNELVVDNIKVVEIVPSRFVYNQGSTIIFNYLKIFGNISRSLVNTGTDLVAYSGFSNSNYLQEPYSSELDFGTGELHLSSWVNVPTVVNPDIFPVISGNLITNGTFDSSTGWTLISGASISGGTLNILNNGEAIQNTGITSGRAYKFQMDVVSVTGGWVEAYVNGQNRSFAGRQGAGLYKGAITSIDTSTLAIHSQVVANSYVIDNAQLFEVDQVILFERSFSSGAFIKLGLMPSGILRVTLFDGTTTRIVTSPSSSNYNIGQWLKVEANYIAGRLSLLINGVEVAATTGNPLLTLNNASAVLTIGNNFELNAPFVGSLALVKLSATTPSAEQSAFMYEQEKQLFRENAKCILPDANTVTDLTYDDVNDQWIAVSSTNESNWTGLVRNSVRTPSAGAFSRVESRSGFKLMARTTTNIGVDISKPSYGILQNMLKKAEDAARLTQDLGIFDFVGGFTATTVNGNVAITAVANLSYPQSFIGARVSGAGIPANTTIVGVSGTTIFLSAAATASASNVSISFLDFNLPAGFDPTDVKIAGVTMREGATRDYIKLYDGFKQTVRFAVAPSATAWIQIICKKEIQ